MLRFILGTGGTGKTAYIRTLSDRDVKKVYGISGGDLPSKKIGTFDRKSGSSSAASASSGSSSSSSSLGSPQVKDIQTKLKALGFYSGSVTGRFDSSSRRIEPSSMMITGNGSPQ